MKIKFELTEEDYLKSYKYFIRNIPEVRNKYIFSVLLFPISMLGVELLMRAFDIGYELPVSYLAASSIILGIILAVILSNYYIKKEIKKCHKVGGHFCEHTIEVNEEGVREKTSLNDTLCNWQAIKDVIENKEYIYIVATSMAILTIPKKAFNSIEEADTFQNKAIKLLKENGTCSNS